MPENQSKICSEGHRYYKISDCPTCPVCEAANKPLAGFLSKIGAPARRALEREGIDTLENLSKRTERELLGLHGIGPSSIPKLKKALEENGLCLKS